MRSAILIGVGAISAALMTGVVMSNASHNDVPAYIVNVDGSPSELPSEIPSPIPAVTTEQPAPGKIVQPGSTHVDPNNTMQVIVVAPIVTISPTGYHS